MPSKVAYIAFVLAIIGIAIGVYSVWPPKIKEYTCNKNTPKEECPLEIDVYGYDTTHSEESEVDGIVWKDHYVDVRVVLRNDSLSKIQSISLVVNPETHIRKAVQATTVPGVNIFPDKGPFREISLTVRTEDGKEIIITPPTSGDYIAPAVIVQCAELLPMGEIKIVTACIALNPSIDGEPPKTLVAPRRPPKWVDIDGAYETIDAGKQSRYHYRYRFPLDLDSKMLRSKPEKKNPSNPSSLTKKD